MRLEPVLTPNVDRSLNLLAGVVSVQFPQREIALFCSSCAALSQSDHEQHTQEPRAGLHLLQGVISA